MGVLEREMADDIPCCATKFWLYLLIVIGLVTFAGLMAGLTLGLMSLGLVDLEVLIKSGRPQDRIHAGTLSPQLGLVFLSFINLGCVNSDQKHNILSKFEYSNLRPI